MTAPAHACRIMQVLSLVPTAPSRMVAAVAGAIPYKLRDRDAQCAYLRAALQLAQAPAAAPVREGILAAAVTHLLGLDVEIRWQDIAAAEAGAYKQPLEACRKGSVHLDPSMQRSCCSWASRCKYLLSGMGSNEGVGPSDICLRVCYYAEAEEEEGESEKEEEDIFALEGETEHLHLSTPGQPQELPNQERIQGRGGWEGAARGAHQCFSHRASCHDTAGEQHLHLLCHDLK